MSFHSFFYILFCGSDFHPSVLQVIYLPPGSRALAALLAAWQRAKVARKKQRDTFRPAIGLEAAGGQPAGA